MGILLIIFIVIVIAAVTGQILLYMNTYDAKASKNIFMGNVLLAIIISYMGYTALPSNYLMDRIISGSWGGLAVLALILELNSKASVKTRKTLVSISIFGGLFQLLFA